ncbi:MAG: hypothetical protein A4E71_02582 [Smithella sp. PtaU1.Bin162]|nr:MAG: hypothetical protein A4E71_02582 [Smithella sp. PtaU1.Bin162]
MRNLWLIFALHLRDVGGQAGGEIEIPCGNYLMTLNQIIGEQTGSDSLGIGFRYLSGNQILAGRVDGNFTLANIVAKQKRDGFTGGFTDVIGYSRTKADFNEPVEIFRERPVDGIFLNDRVGKRARSSFAQFVCGEVTGDGVNFYGRDFFHRQAEIIDDAFFCFFAQCVANAFFETDFDSICHDLP